MENIIDIYNLLPEEINEAIEKLTSALEIVKSRKNTNSKFVDKEKENVVCPCCKSKTIIKNGHDKNKVQTYYCKDCSKKFSSCTNTPIARTKLTYEQLMIFFECMNDKLSIKKTAAKMNCNKNTVFLLRHKVLDSLSEMRKTLKLKGKTEADEAYKSINLKGTKPKNMPRASKHRSSKGGSKRGVSNHQVCIASAIDEHDNFFLEIVGTGPITSEQVKQVFYGKIDKVNYLITDCKSSYEKLAKENNINLEQIKSGTYVNQNGYSLGNINSLHSELSTFLSCFKGVSTKHLQHYLDWFCFQKLINYTTEILKQPLTMMKKTTIKSCNINSNNIYANSSGINFKEVYSDYNFSPLTI
jgi:transposase-like protein